MGTEGARDRRRMWCQFLNFQLLPSETCKISHIKLKKFRTWLCYRKHHLSEYDFGFSVTGFACHLIKLYFYFYLSIFSLPFNMPNLNQISFYNILPIPDYHFRIGLN